MKTKILTMAAMALIGSCAIAEAQTNGDRKGQSATPGHQMQEKGSVPGQPGASGYAPGHTRDADDRLGGRDRDDKTARGDRDDKSARGDRDDKMRGDRDDRTTGAGGRDRDDHLRGDRDDRKREFDKR